MGKKIVGYQSVDGEIFLGKDAQKDMQRHERIIEAAKRMKNIVEYARKVFDVPKIEDVPLNQNPNNDDAETSEKERIFLKTIGDKDCLEDDYYFDNLIEWIVRMKAFNEEAFNKFITAL